MMNKDESALLQYWMDKAKTYETELLEEKAYSGNLNRLYESMKDVADTYMGLHIDCLRTIRELSSKISNQQKNTSNGISRGAKKSESKKKCSVKNKSKSKMSKALHGVTLNSIDLEKEIMDLLLSTNLYPSQNNCEIRK